MSDSYFGYDFERGGRGDRPTFKPEEVAPLPLSTRNLPIDSSEEDVSKKIVYQNEEGERQKKKLLDSKIASQWWARDSILGRDRRLRVLR